MAKSRIMVLGAGGFIGPAVVRRAIAQGHEVIAVSRRGAAVAAEAKALRLDRKDSDAVAACVRAHRPRAIIDLLAYTTEDSLPLFAKLEGQGARYVMASSGDVYRQYDLLHRRDVGDPLPDLTEEAPLRTRPYPYRSDPPRAAADPDAWMDKYDKIPIERALAARRDLSWSILRLPMVYGPGDRNRRFSWALGPMLSGAGALKVDAEWAAWRTSLGFVDDVAEALVLAAVHPKADDRIVNVGPQEVISNQAWAQRLAAALQWKGELQLVTRKDAPEPARRRLDQLDLSVPFALNSNAIREAVGYSEVTSWQDALAATIGAERVRT